MVSLTLAIAGVVVGCFGAGFVVGWELAHRSVLRMLDRERGPLGARFKVGHGDVGVE